MRQLKIYLIASLVVLASIPACAPATATTPNTVPTLEIVTPEPANAPCTSLSAAPTPGPEAPSLFPPITDTDHIRGPEDAQVTIMVYGDLQDATSGLFAGVVQRIQAQYPNDVRLISRVFPLVGRNDKAVLAAQAVEAAHLQNRYWEMYDLLYAQQEQWVNLPVEDFEQWSAAQASGLGMDVEKYQADFQSEAVVDLVQSNFETAREFGPFAVPLIILNGEIYLGPQDFSSLNDIVGLILLGGRQFTECPPMLVESTKRYLATLHTEKGDVVIELFADKTPFTVNSFVFLAQNGWYDNITFHRVIPERYAQTGDPSGTGKGSPGYYVITEIFPDITFDRPGRVGMVNSGPDTSGSQFFITLAPTPQFDGQYTIFGQVLSGLEVLESLTPRNAQPGVESPPGDKLLSIEIEDQ